jgi:hypothetical protein
MTHITKIHPSLLEISLAAMRIPAHATLGQVGRDKLRPPKSKRSGNDLQEACHRTAPSNRVTFDARGESRVHLVKAVTMRCGVTQVVIDTPRGLIAFFCDRPRRLRSSASAHEHVSSPKRQHKASICKSDDSNRTINGEHSQPFLVGRGF